MDFAPDSDAVFQPQVSGTGAAPPRPPQTLSSTHQPGWWLQHKRHQIFVARYIYGCGASFCPHLLVPLLAPGLAAALASIRAVTPSLGAFVGTPELGWGLGSPTCIDLGAAQSIPRGYFCSTKPITLLPRYAAVLRWHEQMQPDAVGTTGWEITSPSSTAPSPPWRSPFLFPCCNYF